MLSTLNSACLWRDGDRSLLTLCVNKTWQCHFSQVGCPRAACFHSSFFCRSSTSQHHYLRKLREAVVLLSDIPVFWLFPWNFCSLQTMRLHFYFTTAFPSISLSCCRTLIKEDRQFRVQFAVIGSFERLEWKLQGNRGASCLPPGLSGACPWAEAFHLRAKSCQTPCSPANQKKLLLMRLFCAEAPPFVSQTHFWLPNLPRLTSSSAKGESEWLGSMVLQSLNDNSPQLVPASTGQGNNISAQ